MGGRPGSGLRISVGKSIGFYSTSAGSSFEVLFRDDGTTFVTGDPLLSSGLEKLVERNRFLFLLW